MRILYVSEDPIPSPAAHGIQMLHMCAAMAELGHDVTFLAPSGSDGPTPADEVFAHYGVPPTFSLRLGVPRPLTAGLAWRIVTARRRDRADLLYTRGVRAAAVGVALGLPTVHEAHQLAPYTWRRERILLRAMAGRRRFVRLVAISDALAGELATRFPRVADRLVVAHSAAAPIDPGLQPAALEGEGTLRVGYVGHGYPGKGAELVDELASLAPWAVFHVVGPSADPSHPAPSNLHRHGFVPPADTSAFRLACDVLLAPYGRRVAPSGGDGDLAPWMSPLKLFEYMAAGQAIVCSDLPVLREVLTDGINALLVPPDDVAAWAAALDRLRADPALRHRLGERARADFLARHTWRARAETVLDGLPSRVVAG